ncbi:LysR family transcriptional regulator [Acidovorax radicis]|uniref:LysR family transcriptional regulator n=1 Tax=Acidovorax radicis TaxID=758826 RepID=UPI001CFC3443|nr:LysR family transcriptional regulator [Acidovorax radicis]UCV00435.1 LysR family transcriptional regulator [Acidovorax radicis]
MNWDDVQVFLAIARHGTQGAAGRALRQSQPTMGRRLRALEHSLGHTLFQRTSEGFVLTDEGAAVLNHAEGMEAQALSLSRQLDAADQQLEGGLRVSTSDWFGLHVMAPICASFTNEHPKVTIELLTDARLFSLARREADLVARIVPFDEPDVIQRRLTHVPYALYIQRDAQLPTQSADVRLITMDLGFSDMPDAVWLREVFPMGRIAFRSNSRHVQAVACASGVGLAVLPCPLGDSHPGLQRLECIKTPPGRDVWLGYHRDLRRLPRLRALVDLLMQRLANEYQHGHL